MKRKNMRRVKLYWVLLPIALAGMRVLAEGPAPMLWDLSVYLAHAAMPFLWVTGANDFAYPLDSLQKSYRLP